ncbi:DUF1722 domain-containing protein [Nonomuraea endophytica]|uniref:DUF1722 domain-containing protein n=1 Tax=Nonomuraea endophytica TaxID=714136 RepID=UPI0037C4F4CE
MNRPVIAVSSCLLGEPVRFNGGHSRDRFLTGPLAPFVDWVPLYPPDGPPIDRRHRGLFADAVLRAHPLLPAEDEGRLNDALLRESFVERVFAHARLRELLAGDWRPRDLVAFHSRHKMQILAHDPVGYQRAGRIVAGAGRGAREELARAYAEAFRRALARKASPGRNVNVLHHCLGMLPLDKARRDDLLAVIDSYKAGLVPLSVPATLLRHHACGENAGYVRDQTYFSPYPDALRLRNHVPA